MKFEGAVLVSNQRLRDFLEVWDKTVAQAIDAEEKALAWAEIEYEKLSCWQKWKSPDSVVIGKYKKLDAVFSSKGFYWGVFDNLDYVLRGLGFLPDRSRYKRLYWDKELADQIYNMERCGEPVYLNPKQAGLVNEFLEMERTNESLHTR